MDLFATIEAESRGRVNAKIPALPNKIDGVNLIPIVTAVGDKSAAARAMNGRVAAAPHEDLYWRSGYNLAVRRGKWKLILDRRHGVTRLYDVVADPGETTDVAPNRPELVRELSEALEEWEHGLEPKRWPRVMDLYMDVYGFRYWFGI